MNMLKLAGGLSCITVFLCLFLFSFSACSSNEEIPTVVVPPDPNLEGDEKELITLKLGFSGPGGSTRADDPIVDNTVDDLWLLLYDDKGQFFEAAYSDAIEPAGNNTWNVEFSLYAVMGDRYKVLCLANTHDSQLFLRDRERYNTITDLKKVSIPLPDHSAEDMWKRPSKQGDPHYSVPMRGVGRAATDDIPDFDVDISTDVVPMVDLSKSIKIKLHYLVARLKFNLQSAIPGIFLKSVQLKNVPARLTPFATTAEIQTAGYEYTTMPVKEFTDEIHKYTPIYYIPPHVLSNYTTAYASCNTYMEVTGYSADRNISRVYRFYPHWKKGENNYDFNLEAGSPYSYNATITGTHLSNLSTSKHWSVTEPNATPEPVALDSKANCIFVLSSNLDGITYGYSFDIAPQITAYKAYADAAVAATPSRILTPNVLLNNGDSWTASILWMEGENLVELDANHFTGTYPADSEIRFTLPNGLNCAGNALVVVKKGSNIIWSWHLWVLPDDIYAPANQNSYIAKNSDHVGYINRPFTLLKYNLGATSTGKPNGITDGYVAGSGNSHSSFGLYYQWGRKDPFRNTGSVTTFSTKTLEYSIRNPGTFIPNLNWEGSDGNYSWGGYSSSVGKGESSNPAGYFYLDNVKSVFDPCPAGYRVPPVGAFDNDEYWYNKGNVNPDFSFGYDIASFGTFPASGCRNSSAQLHYQGQNGFFWTASPSSGGFILDISATSVYPRDNYNRTNGVAIRCMQIVN